MSFQMRTRRSFFVRHSGAAGSGRAGTGEAGTPGGTAAGLCSGRSRVSSAGTTEGTVRTGRPLPRRLPPPRSLRTSGASRHPPSGVRLRRGTGRVPCPRRSWRGHTRPRRSRPFRRWSRSHRGPERPCRASGTVPGKSLCRSWKHLRSWGDVPVQAMRLVRRRTPPYGTQR